MIYRDFQDLKLSGLGMGAMRLPVIDGDDSTIDTAAAEEMVAYAMEHGINYYDTAWGYHGGQSGDRHGKCTEEVSERELLSCNEVPGLRPLQHGQGGRDLRGTAEEMPGRVL